MKPVSFELSSRGIGDAAALDERNFVFVVGGVEYRCCRFQACFVSGLVRRLLASDCGLESVTLKVSDDECHFKDVVSLMNGQKISITQTNAAFLETCARELENDELLGFIMRAQLDHEEVSMSNVVDRIRTKCESHIDYQSELDFIASHFFEVELAVLKCLSASDIELVLTNPLLKLESEDQLYETILSLAAENGDEFLSLLRHIEFVFLSEPKLAEFLGRIFPELLDASVWASLCECVRRFCRSDGKFSLRKSGRYRVDFETFTTANGEFSGIVRHLRDKCDGNPHDKGLISITASSHDRNQCHQVVDYGWSDWWESKNSANSFVQFDFKSKRVCLSHYSLKSDGDGGYHLLSWVLEVSNDGSTWEAVDERNTQDLNGKYIVKTYECSKRSDSFARYVRLRQTGKNSSSSDRLELSEIEFFGKLKNEGN